MIALMLSSALLFAQATTGSQNQNGKTPITETAPDANKNVQNTSSDAIYDIQFEWATAVNTGEAGSETDGTYVYTTLWNGTDIIRYTPAGTYVDQFAIATVAGLRDLAYDGTYFYGGASSTSLWQMDFDAQTLVSTITAPVAVRAIAYDDDADGFWANNWSSDPTLFDASGATLGSFAITGFSSCMVWLTILMMELYLVLVKVVLEMLLLMLTKQTELSYLLLI